jgi:hypothetical protein
MQATIASSSMSPYMWISRPKTSNVLVSGDGIDASRATGKDSARDA